LLPAMSDHEILDVVVDLGADDTLIEQIDLGSVGPVANDSPGPTRRDAGDFEQLRESGVIDVDAVFGRGSVFRGGRHASRIAILILCSSRKTHSQKH
jgi:hypothetical protein